jgi:hypothetical protein
MPPSPVATIGQRLLDFCSFFVLNGVMQRNFLLLEAIKSAIGHDAECEMWSREYFWGRPQSAGYRSS